MIDTIHQILLGDPLKEQEMDGLCGTYREGREKCLKSFEGKT